MIQDAAYASLLKSTRQQVHQQVAQVLEAQFPETVATQPELVAQHYTEAGLTEQAIPYWQRAGQQALQRSANLEAVQHLTTALELLATLPETPTRAQQELDLQLALGPALMATKGIAAPEVEQTYARARALCAQVGDTPQLFPTLWGLWRVLFATRGRCRRHGSWENSSCGWRSVRPIRCPSCEAHEALGTDLILPGRLRRRSDAPRAGDRPHRPGGPARPWRSAMARCLGSGAWPIVANTLWCLGYPAQAVQRSQEALALAQDAGPSL